MSAIGVKIIHVGIEYFLFDILQKGIVQLDKTKRSASAAEVLTSVACHNRRAHGPRVVEYGS